MKLNYYLILTVFFLYNSEWIVNGQVCSNYPYKPGPTSNPTLPNKYTARVEVNMKENQKTMEMRVYYDYSARRAAIEIKDNNIINTLIFNYETDEIYSLLAVASIPTDITPPPDYQPVLPTTCQTYKLSTNTSLNYYFGVSGVTTLYPGPASTFFRFTPQAYNGNDTIRGIPCDSYIGCQYNPATLSNYTIKHYFSQPNFTLSGSNQTYSRLPIRATYEGAIFNPDGTVTPFTYVYNYHEFRLNFDNTIFQTPGGVFCENRKLTAKKTPQIKSNFRFSEEITSKGLTSYITNLVYDESFQLLRYETRERFDGNNETAPSAAFEKDPHIYINDYSIGVYYKTNVNTGRCRIDTIDSFGFAEDQNFTQTQLDSGNGYIIRLKSPSNLLELDADYIYTGQRRIDGLPSDLFIAKVDVSKNLPLVYEYAFTSDGFNFGTGLSVVNNIPKRLAKAGLKSNFESVSTFYNYDTIETNLYEFDVTNCYDPNSLTQFRLTFKPKSDVDSLILKKIDLTKNLRTAMYKILGSLTGELSLRFSIPRIALGENTLIVRSALLPGPQPLQLFKKFPSKLLTNTGFTSVSNVVSDEGCALKCLERNTCLSFDYSNSSKICYLNTKHYTNGTFSSGISSYNHYSRNTYNAIQFNPKASVWSTLQLKFNSKTQSFSIPVKDNLGQMFNLQLDPVIVEEVTGNENRFGSISLISRYRLKKPNFKFSKMKDQLLAQSNINDCAKYCTDEIGITCNSFHFCYLTAECVISKELLPNDDSNYASDSHCDIYEKDALIHYDLFPSKASINPKDKKITEINSESDCAAKCDNEVKINCKSFNYCPNSKECYLSERHLIDSISDSNSGDLTCNHYSRKYIQDFTYINTKEIKLTAEVVLKDASLDICSRECVNADGFNCKSFDYCPETKTCLLNSGQQQMTSNNPNAQVDSCSHYRREYFFVTSSYSEKKKDSSEGVLTALSIVFAIVSCAVGGVGSVFLLKKFSVQKQ